MSTKIKCYMLERVGDDTNWCWRRVDTGEEFASIGQAPVGAMWFAPWYDEIFKPQLEHVLIVKTPGGDWIVDSEANNCTMPNRGADGVARLARKQEDHHCWIIQGEVPDITVDKNGVTCGAGAGSIGQENYHGFLQGGYLVEC